MPSRITFQLVKADDGQALGLAGAISPKNRPGCGSDRPASTQPWWYVYQVGEGEQARFLLVKGDAICSNPSQFAQNFNNFQYVPLPDSDELFEVGSRYSAQSSSSAVTNIRLEMKYCGVLVGQRRDSPIEKSQLFSQSSNRVIAYSPQFTSTKLSLDDLNQFLYDYLNHNRAPAASIHHPESGPILVDPAGRFPPMLASSGAIYPLGPKVLSNKLSNKPRKKPCCMPGSTGAVVLGGAKQVLGSVVRDLNQWMAIWLAPGVMASFMGEGVGYAAYVVAGLSTLRRFSKSVYKAPKHFRYAKHRSGLYAGEADGLIEKTKRLMSSCRKPLMVSSHVVKVMELLLRAYYMTKIIDLVISDDEMKSWALHVVASVIELFEVSLYFAKKCQRSPAAGLVVPIYIAQSMLSSLSQLSGFVYGVEAENYLGGVTINFSDPGSLDMLANWTAQQNPAFNASTCQAVEDLLPASLCSMLYAVPSAILLTWVLLFNKRKQPGALTRDRHYLTTFITTTAGRSQSAEVTMGFVLALMTVLNAVVGGYAGLSTIIPVILRAASQTIVPLSDEVLQGLLNAALYIMVAVSVVKSSPWSQDKGEYASFTTFLSDLHRDPKTRTLFKHCQEYAAHRAFASADNVVNFIEFSHQDDHFDTEAMRLLASALRWPGLNSENPLRDLSALLKIIFPKHQISSQDELERLCDKLKGDLNFERTRSHIGSMTLAERDAGRRVITFV